MAKKNMHEQLDQQRAAQEQRLEATLLQRLNSESAPLTQKDWAAIRRTLKERLAGEIQAGVDQIKQGKYKAYETADEFIDDIERRGRERL